MKIFKFYLKFDKETILNFDFWKKFFMTFTTFSWFWVRFRVPEYPTSTRVFELSGIGYPTFSKTRVIDFPSCELLWEENEKAFFCRLRFGIYLICVGVLN
jgi:hypothetical protein